MVVALKYAQYAQWSLEINTAIIQFSLFCCLWFWRLFCFVCKVFVLLLFLFFNVTKRPMCYFVLQDALNIIDIGIDPVTDESTNTTVRRIQSKIFLLSIFYQYARLMYFFFNHSILASTMDCRWDPCFNLIPRSTIY